MRAHICTESEVNRLMNQRDFKNYQELFELMESQIQGPDFSINLSKEQHSKLG